MRQYESHPVCRAALSEKGDCVGGGLGIVNGQMHKAGAAINGHIEVAFAHVTVCRPQLWQVFDVDMDIAEIIVPEAPLSLGRQG